MKLVVLDTQILIYGVQRNVTSANEELTRRAQRLFSELKKKRTQVIIPAPVVAEFLAGFGGDEDRAVSILRREFLVVPFGVEASRWAAKLRGEIKSLPASERPHPRCVITPDCQIVATALAEKAEAIYTHDVDDLKKIANKHILICGLPPMDMELQFDDDDKTDDGR